MNANKLPCLVYDNNAVLLHIRGLAEQNIDELFKNALHRGDRIVFRRFCSAEFDTDSPDYKMFELNDLADCRYAFLEKNKLRGDTVNIVYLAPEVSYFYPLMSPTSVHYRRLTGECIYEMLYLSHEKTADAPFLSPSAFIALDSIPHLRDELLANPRNPEFCDLRTITQIMIKLIRSIPTFGKTKIDLKCDDNRDNKAAGIIEFSIPAYIYLFASLTYIFYALSGNHRINIGIDFDSAFGNVVFSTELPESREFESDVTSLAELSKLVPSMGTIAEIASVVAFDANVSTAISYDSASGVLSTSVKLGSEYQSIPQFHYRDPYSPVSDIFTEFAQFMQALINGAA